MNYMTRVRKNVKTKNAYSEKQHHVTKYEK